MRDVVRRLRERPVSDAEHVDVGNGVLMRIPSDIQPPPDLLTMGRHSYSPPNVLWHHGDSGRVRIGSFCSVHHTVSIFVGGEHNPDWVTTYPLRARFALPGAFVDGQPRSRGDVIIGNDVYVGYEAMIMSGVTIGDGAVIGARSVVTRDVEPYSVVAGSPAAFRRWRFAADQREQLLQLRWWEWDDATVKDEVDALCSDDVQGFLERHSG